MPKRHRRLAFALALGSGLAAPIVAGAAGGDDVATSRATELTAELSHPAWATRQAAAERLIAIGPSALPVVERALAAVDAEGVTDSERQARLLEIADRLRRLDAAAAVEVEATVGTPAEVIAALASSRAMRLALGNELAGQRTTVTLPAGPFWAGVADLCREEGFDVAVGSGGPRDLRMTLVAGDGGRRQLAGPICLSGPAAILVRGVRQVDDIDFSGVLPAEVPSSPPEGARVDRTLRVELEALLEPRFHIGPRDFVVRWSRATTDGGVSLLPGVPEVGRAAVADADGEVAGPAGDVGHHEAGARWVAGKVKFGIDLVPSRLAPGSRHVTLVGELAGVVGSELSDVRVREDAGAAEWIIAGEPMAVRIVRAGDASTTSGSRARWIFEAVARGRIDDDARRLISGALAGLQAEAGGIRLERGATRHAFDHPRGPRIEIDLLAPAGASAPDRAATAWCEVPRRAERLVLPFRFDGLPLP